MANNGRDHVGRFASGHAGGPGRPLNAITNALRRMTDPDKIAAFLIGVVEDDKATTKDRLAAAQLILDRCEGKAVQTLNMTAQLAPSDLPAEWATMTPAERLAYLDRVRASALGRGANA